MKDKRHHSRGVISLELALISPLVILTFLAVIQLGYLVAVRLVAENAASSAARVIIVRPDQREAFMAANKVTLAILRKPCLSFTSYKGQHVSVKITILVQPFIPALAAFFGADSHIFISSTKTMILEPTEDS